MYDFHAVKQNIAGRNEKEVSLVDAEHDDQDRSLDSKVKNGTQNAIRKGWHSGLVHPERQPRKPNSLAGRTVVDSQVKESQSSTDPLKDGR